MNIYGMRLYKDRFKFSAAHVTIFPDGTAERLHGHNYHMTVEITGERTEMGMLYNPAKIKQRIDELCARLDEKTLLAEQNREMLIEPSNADHIRIEINKKRYEFPKSDIEVLPLINITMEALAHFIAMDLIESLELKNAVPPLHSLKVEIEENTGQTAWYRHHI